LLYIPTVSLPTTGISQPTEYGYSFLICTLSSLLCLLDSPSRSVLLYGIDCSVSVFHLLLACLLCFTYSIPAFCVPPTLSMPSVSHFSIPAFCVQPTLSLPSVSHLLYTCLLCPIYTLSMPSVSHFSIPAFCVPPTLSLSSVFHLLYPCPLCFTYSIPAFPVSHPLYPCLMCPCLPCAPAPAREDVH